MWSTSTRPTRRGSTDLTTISMRRRHAETAHPSWARPVYVRGLLSLEAPFVPAQVPSRRSRKSYSNRGLPTSTCPTLRTGCFRRMRFSKWLLLLGGDALYDVRHNAATNLTCQALASTTRTSYLSCFSTFRGVDDLMGLLCAVTRLSWHSSCGRRFPLAGSHARLYSYDERGTQWRRTR